MSCPDLAVPREVMHHVVRVESSYNPYAIGVVGGRLVRQPRNLPEALSTVRMLEQRGYNFSIGLAQVNRYNLVKYGLETYEEAFQPCANLQAGSRILRECYSRSGGDWGKSFSCYYSGDFRTGFRHGYVQKVYASMQLGLERHAAAVAPIQVIDRASRRAASASARRFAAGSVWRASAGSLGERHAGSLVDRRAGLTRRGQPASAWAGQASLTSQAFANAQASAGAWPGAGRQPAALAFSVPSAQPLPAAGAHSPQLRHPGSPVRVTATTLSAASVGDSAPTHHAKDDAFVF